MKYIVTFDDNDGSGLIQLMSDEGQPLTFDHVNDVENATKESIEAQAIDLELRWIESQQQLVQEQVIQEQIKDVRRTKIQALRPEFEGMKDVPKPKVNMQEEGEPGNV